MIVADLPPRELKRVLGTTGLRMRTGPVVTSIRSTLEAVHRGIGLHYAEHPIEADENFADFHVSVERPMNWRRWFKPQVVFRFDGNSPFAPLPGDQGFPMLEWALNWCVSSQCHEYLILHAAVVEKNGRALILPAPSGSGKSTLCAGLVFLGGWRLLSDELTLIEPGTGAVVPLPRPVSLKNDSIAVMRSLAPQTIWSPVVHDTSKGSVAHVRPPTSSVARANEAAMPAWIVLPRYEAGAAARLEPLSKARTFMALEANAFNYNVHGRAGFEVLAGLVARADCWQFTYSEMQAALAVFDDLADTRPRQ